MRRNARWAKMGRLLAGGLLLTGCGAKPWRGPLARREAAHPGVTTPAQYVAELRQIAASARQASPEERERIAQQLASGLKVEKDSFLRMEVLRTMGTLKCPTSAAILQRGLQDPDSDVRVVCCEAWQTYGGQEATDALVNVVTSDTDPDVRLTAARCLGELRDRRAVPALGQLLEEQDPAMQHRAVASLRQVTGQDLGNDVNAWVEYVQQGAPQRPISWAERVRQLWR